MIRNDGIGGSPRLARYTSIGTPRDGARYDVDPTPNRPPLPKRNPGETDPDQDQRFQLTGARATAPAPAGARNGPTYDGPARSPELSRAVHDANSTARTHIPNRTTGECHRCGGIVAPCRPFLRAMAILDRWDPSSARRIRAVLQLSGLWPTGDGHEADDDDEHEPDADDGVATRPDQSPDGA